MLQFFGRSNSCRLARVTIILILCFVSISICAAFQTFKANQYFNDISQNIAQAGLVCRYAAVGDDNSEDEGGNLLAEKFALEIKRRQSSSRTSSPETYEIDESSQPKPIRKFTGASSPLFTNNGNSQQSNVQREREREFNLAGRFERTFPIQAAILLASAIFISIVGLSGGITDGSDRYFYGDDDLIENAVVEQLERIRTDGSAEVHGSTWI